MSKLKNTTAVVTEVSAEELAALEALNAPAPNYSEVVSSVEMTDTPAAVLVEVPEAATDTAIEGEDEQVPFETLVSTVAADEVENMLTDLNANFDTRVAFEQTKDAGNSNIMDTIKKEREKMVRPGLAAVLVAAEVNAGFINREEHSGKRFNVYAINKVNDVIYGLSTGYFKNAINNAVLRSMFKCQKAGVPFTGLVAQAAASDKVKIDKAIEAILVRHTVSASTAPTQSSSTMNALEVLGVVKNTGTSKNPIYALTDAPIVGRIQTLMGV